MILTEYDIQYTTQKAIKGSALADHLAHQVVDDYQSMNFEFPDKNMMWTRAFVIVLDLLFPQLLTVNKSMQEWMT